MEAVVESITDDQHEEDNSLEFDDFEQQDEHLFKTPPVNSWIQPRTPKTIEGNETKIHMIPHD